MPQLHGLQNVLQERYRCDVQLELMNYKTHPQQQAFKHLANFVEAHKRPRTLLIIYYAGHGFDSGKDDNRMALSGRRFIDDEEKAANSIMWDDVERTLSTTPSDVLVIFDCCQAGLLCRSARQVLLHPNRSFQFLGACESGQVTNRAGPKSFTSAMIWALDKLANEATFPVTKLVKTIEEHDDFPRDQKPVLFGGRFDPVAENICITHMRGPASRGESVDPTASPRDTPPTKGVLELRLHFPNEVTEDDIVDSARTLKNCMQKVTLHCHGIAFLDMYATDSTALMKRVALKWRKVALREHGQRVEPEPGITSNSVATATESEIRPTKQDVNPGTIWRRQVVVSWGALVVTFASLQAFSLIVVRSLYL